LDLQKILSDLNAEKDRIVRAIAALTGMGSSKPARKTAANGRRRRGPRRGGMTPEARRRLSLAMKRRWAERRKKGA
jgi:hypothetical protein